MSRPTTAPPLNSAFPPRAAGYLPNARVQRAGQGAGFDLFIVQAPNGERCGVLRPHHATAPALLPAPIPCPTSAIERASAEWELTLVMAFCGDLRPERPAAVFK